jgi:hypothetical protein
LRFLRFGLSFQFLTSDFEFIIENRISDQALFSQMVFYVPQNQ